MQDLETSAESALTAWAKATEGEVWRDGDGWDSNAAASHRPLVVDEISSELPDDALLALGVVGAYAMERMSGAGWAVSVQPDGYYWRVRAERAGVVRHVRDVGSAYLLPAAYIVLRARTLAVLSAAA